MNNENCIRVFADIRQINNCKEKLEVSSQSINLLSRALSLAGNESRLKIIYLLWDQQKLCVCDISDILGMSIPGISQHLRKLSDGNIVKKQKVAQTIFYSLNSEYETLFLVFFEKIKKNQILEPVGD
ncbi:MAG: winged helix-turn-helix transcriptional regulator [Flavobacteriales bacterium]|nr:winged helix-turn-helix transcriptional regulator [Flavobacteriales bacterium]